MTESYYISISLHSRLYQRLCTEPVIYQLFAGSYHSRFRLIDENEPETIEEALEYWTETYPNLFHTETKTRRIIENFQVEIENASLRTAYLEQIEPRIAEALSQELRQRQSEDIEVVRKLLYGDRYFEVHGQREFKLVPLPTVQAGAKMLMQMEPQDLFEIDSDWTIEKSLNKRDESMEECCARFFSYWKDLYLDAAEQENVILIAST
ncbi:hypothetical protein LEP3755_32960 [Leptolyngbya sp. NIES-3755]|nr:hypothetical protein LEP3755_32960 [Leptolyngbya sp. NIES-3755]